LEIAEVDIQGITLDGSLLITAENVLGHILSSGQIVYSSLNGKCELKNVTIVNKGINASSCNRFWANEIVRHEALEIILHGNAEFSATNVTFNGPEIIDVPNGYRLEIVEENGERIDYLISLEKSSWYWEYTFDASDAIKLQKQFS
jgi:hypothetical protein